MFPRMSYDFSENDTRLCQNVMLLESLLNKYGDTEFNLEMSSPSPPDFEPGQQSSATIVVVGKPGPGEDSTEGTPVDSDGSGSADKDEGGSDKDSDGSGSADKDSGGSGSAEKEEEKDVVNDDDDERVGDSYGEWEVEGTWIVLW